jgi:hypothetical protein
MSSFDEMLAETAALAGVPVSVVEQWTFDDWQRHVDRLEARQTAFIAAADRDEAACAEASRCGCPLEAEVEDDGSPVIGTARVVHVCGWRR